MNFDIAFIVLDILTLENREQCIVDEIQQLVAGHCISAFIVMCPITPAARFGNDRRIASIINEPVLFLGIVYFQEQHPCNLFNTLCITIDTRVVAHDVTKSFDKIPQTTHHLYRLINFVLQFPNRFLVSL